jgi:hypothetical protein
VVVGRLQLWTASSGPAAGKSSRQKGSAIAGGEDAKVADLLRSLAAIRPCADSAGLIDQLRELEDLRCAAAGLQPRIAVAFDVVQRRSQAAAGLPVSELGKGVAAQIALARGESPACGNRILGPAKALGTEMPHTLEALRAGELSAWRATLLVRETACLSAADRCAVDEQLAPDTGRLSSDGNRALVAVARQGAYRLAPRSLVNRARRAAADRYVSLRPAPDTWRTSPRCFRGTAAVSGRHSRQVRRRAKVLKRAWLAGQLLA